MTTDVRVESDPTEVSIRFAPAANVAMLLVQCDTEHDWAWCIRAEAVEIDLNFAFTQLSDGGRPENQMNHFLKIDDLDIPGAEEVERITIGVVPKGFAICPVGDFGPHPLGGRCTALIVGMPTGMISFEMSMTRSR